MRLLGCETSVLPLGVPQYAERTSARRAHLSRPCRDAISASSTPTRSDGRQLARHAHQRNQLGSPPCGVGARALATRHSRPDSQSPGAQPGHSLQLLPRARLSPRPRCVAAASGHATLAGRKPTLRPHCRLPVPLPAGPPAGEPLAGYSPNFFTLSVSRSPDTGPPPWSTRYTWPSRCPRPRAGWASVHAMGGHGQTSSFGHTSGLKASTSKREPVSKAS
mmetsp:Transcript_15077/g.56844  ORF Transcript_15077/g.56844 Transcript_15077/m.56844 type:complete len:220 (+) Transcript_15077:1952-2611(+)